MYPGFTDYSAPSQYNPSFGAPSNNESPTTGTGTVFTPSTPTGNSSLNYTNNTNEYMRLLSGAERRELEVPREIFVSIKMLDVLEKAFTFGKATDIEHHQRTENILNKVEKLIQILKQKNPKITVESFIQEYGLSDCTWAIQRINKVKEPSTGQSVHALVASVTSGFIKLPDYFFIHGEDAQVKDVLPMLQEMKQLLDNLKAHFSKPGQPFNLSERYGPLIVKLSSMGLNDTISSGLATEIQDVNEFTKNTFQIYLR